VPVGQEVVCPKCRRPFTAAQPDFVLIDEPESPAGDSQPPATPSAAEFEVVDDDSDPRSAKKRTAEFEVVDDDSDPRSAKKPATVGKTTRRRKLDDEDEEERLPSRSRQAVSRRADRKPRQRQYVWAIVGGLIAVLLLIGVGLLARRVNQQSERYDEAARRPIMSSDGPLPNSNGPKQTQAAGTAWTWRSDAHGFEITLPNRGWSQNRNLSAKNPNVIAMFTCATPRINAWVAVEPWSDDRIAGKLGLSKMQPKTNTPEKLIKVSEPNAHGNLCWLVLKDDQGEKGPYIVGMCVSKVRDKAVVLFLEGYPQSINASQRAAQESQIRAQAQEFLLSVR
jgi:hypothetical protein